MRRNHSLTVGVGTAKLAQTGDERFVVYSAGLPTDGRTLNVRLWSLVNGAGLYNDYTYTALWTTLAVNIHTK